MYTPHIINQHVPQPQLVPVAPIYHAQVNPSLFAYKQSQWQRHFCPLANRENLLLECKCQAIDSKTGVMDADLFISERYISILIDRHITYAIPLRTLISWCRAAVLETPGLPPYVKLAVFPNMDGDGAVRKIPSKKPGGIVLFTSENEAHQLFGFTENLDKIVYFIDSNWRKNCAVEALVKCMPNMFCKLSATTQPALRSSNFFAKQQAYATGVSSLSANISSSYMPQQKQQQQPQQMQPQQMQQQIMIPPLLPPQPQQQHNIRKEKEIIRTPEQQPQFKLPPHPSTLAIPKESNIPKEEKVSNPENESNNSDDTDLVDDSYDRVVDNDNISGGDDEGSAIQQQQQQPKEQGSIGNMTTFSTTITGGFNVVQTQTPNVSDIGTNGEDAELLKSSTFMPWDKMQVAPQPLNLTFGIGSDQAQVDYVYKENIMFGNRASQKHSFCIILPKSDKFTVTAEPLEGTLKGGKDVTVTFSMVVGCTCITKVTVFLVSWRGDIKDRDKSQKSYSKFDVDIESEPSVKLDYSELTLFSPPIGSGSFGDVFRGEYRDQEVAIKVLKYQDAMTDDMLRDFHNEVKIMEKLRNNYIITFIGAVHVPGKLAIVTEFCSYGSLTSAVKNKKFREIHKIKALLDVANGLVFLHGSGIIHRDLKPDNILMISWEVRAPVMCKISDFGTTRGVNKFSKEMNLTRGVGTPIFMAPELIKGARNYEKPADIYSFGLTMCNVITEKTPFEGDTTFKTSYRIYKKLIIYLYH